MENGSIDGLQTVKRDSLHNYAYGLLAQLPNRKVEFAKRYSMWLDKFWRRVSKDPDGCWRIRGRAGNKAGHVMILHPHGYRVYAHRMAWWLANGAIPKGQSVLHSCDVARCVNPAHLFLGSQADNMHDAVRKGRKNCWGIQKLTAVQVHQIRALGATGMLHKDIARQFGVARNTVSSILSGKSWRHLPVQSPAPAASASTSPARVRRPLSTAARSRG